MRYLLDANLSPRVADALRHAGLDVLHVVDLELERGVIVSLSPTRLAVRDLPIK